MLNRFASLRLVAWFVVLASPALVYGQTLADRVPADTVLYVGWSGAASPGPGFEGSHLQAVLADSNISKVFEEMMPKVLDRIAQENHDAADGVDVARALLGPMWKHPTAVAFVSVDIDPNKGPKNPKAVVLCDAGNDAAALQQELAQILLKAGPAPFPVRVINHHGLVALVIGYDKPEDAIPEAGADGKSLANNPDFIKALSQVGKNAVVTGYVNVEKGMNLVEMGIATAPPEVQKNWGVIREKLGIKGIKRAIWTEGFDGKDWASQIFVAAPAPREGFLGSLIEGKPLSKHILDTIPENAAMAGACHFDIAALVDAIRAAASSDPETARQIDGAFDQINKAISMNLQKDVLSTLGDEWAYYNDPDVAGNGIVGTTLVNHLKDPAGAEAALIKLEVFFNIMVAKEMQNEKMTIAFRQAKFGDVTVHYLGFPVVCPSWCVHNGNLYIALYPEVCAAAAAHVPGQGKSITTNPAYVALMNRMGGHPVSSFGFVDIPRLAPENYGVWLAVSHLANFGDLFGIPAPVMIIPPLPKLMAQLSAAGQTSWTDDEGLHVHGLAPFPCAELFGTNPTMFVATEAMSAGMMMPYLMARGRFILEKGHVEAHAIHAPVAKEPQVKH